jgi:hypothetical protein
MVATETSAQLVAVAGSGSSDLGWGHRNNSGTEMVQVALRRAHRHRAKKVSEIRGARWSFQLNCHGGKNTIPAYLKSPF